jgi:hypothetical protein
LSVWCSVQASHSTHGQRLTLRKKCITGAKARRVSKVAELIDLYWDRESRDGSLDHSAGVLLPRIWQDANFFAQPKREVRWRETSKKQLKVRNETIRLFRTA